MSSVKESRIKVNFDLVHLRFLWSVTCAHATVILLILHDWWYAAHTLISISLIFFCVHANPVSNQSRSMAFWVCYNVIRLDWNFIDTCWCWYLLVLVSLGSVELTDPKLTWNFQLVQRNAVAPPVAQRKTCQGLEGLLCWLINWCHTQRWSDSHSHFLDVMLKLPVATSDFNNTHSLSPARASVSDQCSSAGGELWLLW